MRQTGLRALLVAASCAATLGLGACTIVRNALGTHDSACFKALPAANNAVKGVGRFSGLRFTTFGDLEDALGRSPGGISEPQPTGFTVARRTGICVVAYHGFYETGDVLEGWSPTGTPSGQFAFVVVRQDDLQLLGTVIMEREPIRFIRTYPRL